MIACTLTNERTLVIVGTANRAGVKVVSSVHLHSSKPNFSATVEIFSSVWTLRCGESKLVLHCILSEVNDICALQLKLSS
jgi:hypothetical protein